MIGDSIRMLIEILMEEPDVDEIEVRRFFTTIRVARRRGACAETAAPAPPSQARRDAPQAASAASQLRPAPGGKLREITSPMVGTFYRSRDPQAAPFVEEGSAVQAGEVLCIIEAMKLMNEIESETAGVIRKILAENAQPVEFGQPLFLIESA